MHDTLWEKARRREFAFRRLYDGRSALTLTAQGVIEFATVNVQDDEGMGFRKVWNPLLGDFASLPPLRAELVQRRVGEVDGGRKALRRLENAGKITFSPWLPELRARRPRPPRGRNE